MNCVMFGWMMKVSSPNCDIFGVEEGTSFQKCIYEIIKKLIILMYLSPL